MTPSCMLNKILKKTVSLYNVHTYMAHSSQILCSSCVFRVCFFITVILAGPPQTAAGIFHFFRLQYHFFCTNDKNFTNMKGHWTCQTIFVKINGSDVFVFAYVLYCICICAALYLYLWQPMMMERGLWNFVYPHLSKSGHYIAMPSNHYYALYIYIHTKQDTLNIIQ